MLVHFFGQAEITPFQGIAASSPLFPPPPRNPQTPQVFFFSPNPHFFRPCPASRIRGPLLKCARDKGPPLLPPPTHFSLSPFRLELFSSNFSPSNCLTYFLCSPNGTKRDRPPVSFKTKALPLSLGQHSLSPVNGSSFCHYLCLGVVEPFLFLI